MNQSVMRFWVSMVMDKTAFVFLLHSLTWLLLNSTLSYGTLSDIHCLKALKASLEDPFQYLNSSWNFSNNTEGFICKFTGVECWTPDENRVLNIRLSDMGLKGQFPRGIENCTSLTGLDLSSNQLSGPIPFDISKRLQFVFSLDLSSNNLSREIPLSIANCSYLNMLKLDNNRLTGQIPQQLGKLRRLKTFSVANNLLSGQVPTFLYVPVGPESYENNPGLCGKPLDPCKGHQKKYHTTFISGFAVGWVVSTVLVVVSILFFHFRRDPMKKKTKNIKAKSRGRKQGRHAARFILYKFTHHCSTVGQRTLFFHIFMFEKLATRMGLRDLMKATSNFSEDNIIGSGRTGTMYKAVLPNGWSLAVKRSHDSQHFLPQFTAELTTLSRVRHSNSVPLLGFCIDGKERLLIYKYMSNGNLHDLLHSVESKAKIMDWPLRLKIGIGLARGLAWLHHNCKICIIHGNICSKCILLDQNFEPKISNFGKAMIMNLDNTHSSMNSFVNGEFEELAQPVGTRKGDVYGFGTVLLELVTGERSSQVCNASASFNGTLVEWITHLLSSSSSGLYDAVDKSLIGKGYDGEIFQFLKVACNCVQPSPNERPTMLEVCQILKTVGERCDLMIEDPEVLMSTATLSINSRLEHIGDEIVEEIQ
ncbi:hypothetical protein HHK36_020222 [Tetracentron sinense]|uniref:Protein kinase domain-containing protein n=1 Tax=Tetracentron sinense TaxID=13715 RepID=A0A834YV24_TETSI|nr:hypothetical protein HHK36_020222 [Tetracentron sinense]